MYTKAEKLIRIVKSHPVLYDYSHGDYCKTKLKDEIWQSIAETLNIESGRKAKDQWQKLRDSHRNALKRHKRRRSNSTVVEIKPWMYQDQMEFLIPFMTSSGTMVDDTEIVMITEDYEEQEEEEEYILSETPVVVFDSTNDSIDQFPEIEIDPSYNTYRPPPPPKRRQRISKYEILKDRIINGEDISNRRDDTVVEVQLSEGRSTFEIIHGRVGMATNKELGATPAKKQKLSKYEALQERVMNGDISTVNREIEEDKPRVALRQFFDSMYNLTKAMPPHLQAKVRRKMFEAVTEAEEEIFSSPAPSLVKSKSTKTFGLL